MYFFLKPFSSKYVILGLCLLTGVLFRLYAISNQGLFSRDSYTYVAETQEGMKYPDSLFSLQKAKTTPPLFLILMQIASKTFGSAERGGLVLNISAGIALIGVCFYLGLLITDNNFFCGCFAFLVAVNPVLVKLSVQIQRESCYLLCAVLSLCFFISSVEQTTLWKKHLWCFFCGVLSAATSLIRFEGIELFLIFSCSMLLIGIYQKAPWYRALLFPLLLGIGGFCFVSLLLLFSDCNWEYLQTILMRKREVIVL